MNTGEHWTRKYMQKGKGRWEPGARGPNEWDCWGLIVVVFKIEYGIELPLHPDASIITLKETELVRLFSEEIGSGRWEQVEKPFDGCVVALGKRKRAIHHCGLYVDQGMGMIFHCNEKINTVCQPVYQMKAQGFQRMEFFRYATTT